MSKFHVSLIFLSQDDILQHGLMERRLKSKQYIEHTIVKIVDLIVCMLVNKKRVILKTLRNSNLRNFSTTIFLIWKKTILIISSNIKIKFCTSFFLLTCSSLGVLNYFQITISSKNGHICMLSPYTCTLIWT